MSQAPSAQEAKFLWHRLGRATTDLDRNAREPRWGGHHRLSMTWKESACGRYTASNRATTSAGCRSVLIQSRSHPRDASCATSAAFGTRLLSDQLSDYRVDDPYIRGHIHGPCPRSVLDLHDSPTVLRKEEVVSRTGSNPSRHERHGPDNLARLHARAGRCWIRADYLPGPTD
jgi:hypothetical protein